MRHLTFMGLAALTLGAACGGDSSGFTLGPEAQIDISPLAIEFGDVPRGEAAVRIVTVRHAGTSGRINLDPVELVTDSPDLSIGLVERTSLGPGEASRIQVVYNSDHDERDEGELVIGHNLADNPETRVVISTAGQRAQLIASPGVLDFAVVQAGAPRTLELTVYNGGTAPATLTGFETAGDDEDFHVDLAEGISVPIAGSATLSVTYAPTNRDADTATLTLLTEREDVSLEVVMYGEEETPVLAVEPGLVQLGWTVPFEVSARNVVVRNDGNAPLVVDQIALGPGAPDTLALTQVPAGSFTLRPDEAIVFGVVFAPVEEHPMTAEPLGYIGFASNDEARSPLNVPVFGAAGDPSITVVPEDVVDFAYVAEGFTATRSVVVLNEGVTAVIVDSAQLLEPTTEEFSFANPEALPATLNPGEAVELELRFDNTGGADGSEYAKFRLYTDDPVVPEYPLDVVARRAQRPTCEAAFVPELLAFGAFRPGETGTGTMRLVNYGSGNCEYREYEMSGCLQVQAGVRYYFDCDPDIAFNPFEVLSAPVEGDLIGPGEAVDIEIAYHAPDSGDFTYGRESYYGRLAALLHDPNSNRFQFAAPAGGWSRGVNLRAETAVPIIEVEPPLINFGLVRTDCQSHPSRVTVSASGPMDATITGIELLGCPGAVAIDAPPLPATVPGFSTLAIDLTYSPGVLGAERCTLRITNDSENLPVAEVELLGEGIDVDHQIDVFDQVPPAKVDVLFVVDDSFSMGDDQQRLKQELPKIVDIANRWGQDIHMAVTTTDTVLVRGQFRGQPPYATSADDPATFAANLVVGTTGHWEERGLEGAYLALYNRSVRTDIACQNVPNACPLDDGEGMPLICLEGYCSGRNWGFLRDDAELVIIIVSDEEDASSKTVPFYTNRFASLKAPNSGVGVKVHAIIVTEDGCPGGFGTPGLRYLQAVEAFGGHISDICGDSFGDEFIAVGEQTFGLKDRFYPTIPPDASTIQVRVNGASCTSGWTWNDTTQAVVFQEGGGCYPDYGDRVEIEYDVYCAAPAP